MKSKVTIGITDCSKFDNYVKWLMPEEGVEVIKLSYHNRNLKDLDKCGGVILSGGEDVHPRYYGRTDYVEYCTEIDEQRDDFEWSVLEYAEEKALPVLGICRGLQIANVFYGGTLIPDIPSFGRFNHSKFPKADRMHTIQVDPNSELHKIVGGQTGEINSSHHQSSDLIGKDLVANAVSPDGIVEGIERKSKEGKPFLLLVQWHPERMVDQESPFSKNIRRNFIEAVKQSSK